MSSTTEKELQGQVTSVPDAPHLMLNVENLHKFLVRSNVEGYRENDPPRLPDVRKFSTGQSNPTYLIDGKFVLRKQPPGARSNATAHRLDREFAVLQALQKTDVPAPKPIAFCDDPQVLNGQFYLMSFVKGRVLSSPALVGMNPNERRAAYRSVIETLVKLHAVDWRKIGLHEYGQCGNMYVRQLGSLMMVSNQQEAVSPKVPKIPHRDDLTREMRLRMPDDDVALVHGDWKWDNFLIHPTEPKVVAVLDWELSTIGHPLSDLANMCGMYYSPYNPESPIGGGLGGMPDIESSGIPSLEELVHMYTTLSGRVISDAAWKFALCFYFWRGSIIAQGIAARLVSGQASSSVGELFVKSMPGLAQLARNEMDELIAIQGDIPPPQPTIIGANLTLDDDYTHRSKGEATNYNESVYCNFHTSTDGSVGGFIRIGNRPNENFAEVTLCIFNQATNQTLFHFSRPKIESNNGWDCLLSGGRSEPFVGRVQYKVRRPMNRIQVSFQGRMYHLKKPWLLRDPEALFQKHKNELSSVTCKFEIEFSSCGPVFGSGAAVPAKGGENTGKSSSNDFARSHYEQHGSTVGKIDTLETKDDGKSTVQSITTIQGFGLRDHSWGPRYWQSISSYRWVTCNFGPRCGFTFSVIGNNTPVLLLHLENNKLVVFKECSILTRYCDESDPSLLDIQWFQGINRPIEAPQKHHYSFVISAERAEDATTRQPIGKQTSLTIHARVLGYVPLRNRREEKITCLGEAFTEYRVQRQTGLDGFIRDSEVGYGMSEYLDQQQSNAASKM